MRMFLVEIKKWIQKFEDFLTAKTKKRIDEKLVVY